MQQKRGWIIYKTGWLGYLFSLAYKITIASKQRMDGCRSWKASYCQECWPTPPAPPAPLVFLYMGRMLTKHFDVYYNCRIQLPNITIIERDRVHREALWNGATSDVEDEAVVGCNPIKNWQVPVDGFVVVTSARPWKLHAPVSWSLYW